MKQLRGTLWWILTADFHTDKDISLLGNQLAAWTTLLIKHKQSLLITRSLLAYSWSLQSSLFPCLNPSIPFPKCDSHFIGTEMCDGDSYFIEKIKLLLVKLIQHMIPWKFQNSSGALPNAYKKTPTKWRGTQKVLSELEMWSLKVIKMSVVQF